MNVDKDASLYLIINQNFKINICSDSHTNIENFRNNIINAYIVGGYGEVDAMSVAPLAVRQGAPIIVSPRDGLTKDEKYFFESNENIADVKVIGGRVNVDTQVMLDVKNCGYDRDNNTDISVSRVSGNDRQETNAKILELFDKGSEENIIVAKDGMNNKSHLVDSLSAATLGYPLILGTERITMAQVDAIYNIVSKDINLIQVGNGIDNALIKKVLDIIK